MIGRVVSVKTNRTVTVVVERTAKHPLYKKTFLRTKKYLVHTEIAAKEGDIVEFIKTKPISKNKHWKINKIVGKSLAEINEEKLKDEAEKIIAEVMPEEKIEEPSVVSPQTEVKKVDEKQKKPRKRKEKSDS